MYQKLYIYMDINMHTNITYIHAYIHAYIHPEIETYLASVRLHILLSTKKKRNK